MKLKFFISFLFIFLILFLFFIYKSFFSFNIADYTYTPIKYTIDHINENEILIIPNYKQLKELQNEIITNKDHNIERFPLLVNFNKCNLQKIFPTLQYNKNLSIIYLCYVLLLCFSRLGIFLYLYSKMNAIERQDHIFDFVLISLGFVISIWISKIVYKFVFYLNKLSDYELTSLQLGLIIIDNRPQIFW